jgi:hypothetical protein
MSIRQACVLWCGVTFNLTALALAATRTGSYSLEYCEHAAGVDDSGFILRYLSTDTRKLIDIGTLRSA